MGPQPADLINFEHLLNSDIFHRFLSTHHAFDSWPRVIVFESEILEFEIKNILYFRIYNHTGQFSRSPRKLLFHLVEMVEIDVRVACGVDKFTRLKTAHLRHHHA